MKFEPLKLGCIFALTVLLGCSTGHANPKCDISQISNLPDVKITSVSAENGPAPHCKVAGVIGTETNFELLLPDKWNGKFVMGGGGRRRAMTG
jgi:feruloyl esterase